MKRLKPIVCTLSDQERRLRTFTWREVVQCYAGEIVEQVDGYVLTLTAEPEGLAGIKGLVESEQRCCEWMDLRFDSGDATLTITSASRLGKSIIADMLGL